MQQDLTEDYALATNCLSILEEGHSVGSGIYWFDDGQGNALEVYCDMESAGGGWLLFGILDSTSNHLAGSQFFGSVFEGDLNNTGYSLDIDVFDVSENTDFDVMIQYGDIGTYNYIVTGLPKMEHLFLQTQQKVVMEVMVCLEQPLQMEFLPPLCGCWRMFEF